MWMYLIVTPSLSLLGTREKGHHFLLLSMLSVMFFYAVAVVLILLVVCLWLFDNIGRLPFVLVLRGHGTGIAVLAY